MHQIAQVYTIVSTFSLEDVDFENISKVQKQGMVN